LPLASCSGFSKLLRRAPWHRLRGTSLPRLDRMGKGNKGSGGGGGGAGPSNGAGPGKGVGGGGSSVKPGKPGKRKSSGMDPRYLYAACALAIAAAAIGFQQFAAVYQEATQEPPKVQDAPGSQKRAGTVPSETPPRRKAAVEAGAAAQKIDPTCVDEHENCAYWAKSGECDNNEGFMKVSCKASCGVCKGGKPPPRCVLGIGLGLGLRVAAQVRLRDRVRVRVKG
jgi:hypothetical protein